MLHESLESYNKGTSDKVITILNYDIAIANAKSRCLSDLYFVPCDSLNLLFSKHKMLGDKLIDIYEINKDTELYVIIYKNEMIISAECREFKFSENSSNKFYNCKKIKSIHLEHVDTYEIVNMNYMFSGCNNLEYIAARQDAFKNAKFADLAFKDCSKLREIDFNKLGMHKIEYAYRMFYGCDRLKTIIAEKLNFDTDHLFY